jgi:hypothetical protein
MVNTPSVLSGQKLGADTINQKKSNFDTGLQMASPQHALGSENVVD